MPCGRRSQGGRDWQVHACLHVLHARDVHGLTDRHGPGPLHMPPCTLKKAAENHAMTRGLLKLPGLLKLQLTDSAPGDMPSQ